MTHFLDIRGLKKPGKIAFIAHESKLRDIKISEEVYQEIKCDYL